MGDPAGIGPEIILKAFGSPQVHSACHPLVFGAARFLNRRKAGLSCELDLIEIDNPDEASFKRNALNVVECPAPTGVRIGKKSAVSGRLSIDYLDKAIESALQGKVDAIVTAPLSKAAVRLAGETDFVGHTEYLADRTDVSDCAMMFFSDRLKVVLVTTHLALREVADSITTGKIVRAAALANDALKKLGFRRPRIGIAALNPHAGVDAAFGDEDKRIVAPAARQARRRGIDAEGPLPADTLFHAAYGGAYDLVVAMYHDQALAPFKMIAFDEGVNITLGLPFVRTSVDHGTAFDIAGKGLASEKSLVEAIKLAARLAK